MPTRDTGRIETGTARVNDDVERPEDKKGKITAVRQQRGHLSVECR
jgi:hypothetical protein